ncbi:MAG: lysoplasmalogenase family protein [Bacteroidota bacterium]
MQKAFNNILFFSLCYFSIMALDLSFMIFSDLESFRLGTKPSLIILLIIYYASNDNESISRDFLYTILALAFFMLANIATYFYLEPLVLVAASAFFILGKVFYVFRFSNKNLFDIINFLPFLGFYLLYIFIILKLTLDNLGSSLIPILLFLFVTLLALQFAFLRKGAVSKLSYNLVIIGMFSFVIADTLSVLASFYKYWPWEKYFTMVLYALAQYLIIMGLVKEKKEAKDSGYP